jgi:tellurium resistance protein TerZ
MVFTVNSFQGDTFDRIENAFVRLVDATTGQEMARYDLSGSGSHTAQIMAKLTRSGGGWTMTAVGAITSGRTFHDMMPAIVRTL